MGEEVKNNWIYKEKRESGGKIVYSDMAIEFCLTIKRLYNLGYRQTEGFVSDIFKQLKIELPIPSYTQGGSGKLGVNITILRIAIL